MRFRPGAFLLLSIFALEACKLQAPKRPDFSKHSALKPGTGTGTIDGTPQEDLKCSEDTPRLGLRAWRRLSNVEIRNTVVDIFQVKDADTSSFPADTPKKELYDTMSVSSNHLSDARFLPLESFAKEIAAKANLNTFFPCLKDGVSCINKSLPTLLGNAWRRPSTAAENTELSALFSLLIKDGLTAEESARDLISAIILSHNFLYRSELGTLKEEADNSYVLDDYEIAAAISYTIWRRPPDSTLKNLAKSGGLKDSDAIRAIATKMMNDPKAREAWKDFGNQWLDGHRIQNSVKTNAPDFTPQVKNKLKEEASNFLTFIMFDKEGGTYKDLLLSAEAPTDPALDSFYGAKASGKTTKYAHEQRRGLLGQVSFLASHATADMANPVTRGAFIADRILCEQFIGAPPTTAPEPEPGMSAKELFAARTKPAGCQSCHKSIDGLGYALGNFDHLGRFQKEDNGKPVETNGTFTLDDKPVSFSSPQELTDAIAASVQGQMCFVRQVFNYGYGRKEFAWRPVAGRPAKPGLSAQGKLDFCEIKSATAAMVANNGDLKSVIVEFLASPAFRHRVPGQPEILK